MSERGPFLVARLTRRRDGRWVAGVCNGLAAALGVRVDALRAVIGLLAIGNLPAVALLYGLAWVFLPVDDEEGGDPGDRAERASRPGVSSAPAGLPTSSTPWRSWPSWRGPCSS